MIAVDSSVVVAAFASWHESHGAARDAVAGAPLAVGHALLETYSVLTRLPPPHRADPTLVGSFLAAAFPASPLVLSAEDLQRFLVRLPGLLITGGAVYDALIGASAEAARATLLSLDSRAMRTYERIGCDARMLVG